MEGKSKFLILTVWSGSVNWDRNRSLQSQYSIAGVGNCVLIQWRVINAQNSKKIVMTSASPWILSALIVLLTVAATENCLCFIPERKPVLRAEKSL